MPLDPSASSPRRLPAFGTLCLIGFWILVLGVSPSSAAGLQVAELKRETSVDFEKEILPIFRNSCLACHNTTKAKGGLNLETPQLILKGGDTGPAAVPGKSGESLLLKASLQTDPELIMPPKDNKANAPNLTPDQLALVKLLSGCPGTGWTIPCSRSLSSLGGRVTEARRS